MLCTYLPGFIFEKLCASIVGPIPVIRCPPYRKNARVAHSANCK